MRIVKVQGGLGNQLFCVGLARTVALITRSTVGLDTGSYANDRYGSRFALQALCADLGDFESASAPFLSNRILAALLRAAPSVPVAHDRKLPDGPASLERLIRRNQYFDGYWQHELYLRDPAPLIRAVRDFILRKATAPKIHDLVIHYRTYREEVRPERRGTPDADYFARAAAEVEARLGAPASVALISDNVDLALKRIGTALTVTDAFQGSDVFTDMATMFLARALILSNSSFSWWGGFCSNSAVAIYPQRKAMFHYAEPASRFTAM